MIVWRYVTAYMFMYCMKRTNLYALIVYMYDPTNPLTHTHPRSKWVPLKKSLKKESLIEYDVNGEWKDSYNTDRLRNELKAWRELNGESDIKYLNWITWKATRTTKRRKKREEMLNELLNAHLNVGCWSQSKEGLPRRKTVDSSEYSKIGSIFAVSTNTNSLEENSPDMGGIPITCSEKNDKGVKLLKELKSCRKEIFRAC